MSTTGSFGVLHLKLTWRSLMLIRKLLKGKRNWANAQLKRLQSQWKAKTFVTANERPYELFHRNICSQCVHLNAFCWRIVLHKHSALFLRIIRSVVLKIASLLSGNSCSCNNCWTDVRRTQVTIGALGCLFRLLRWKPILLSAHCSRASFLVYI